jgi:hypothetical protein
MMGIDDAVAAGSALLNNVISRIWPDPTEAEKAKIAALQAESAAALDLMRVKLSAILAEAQSPDPWTSRARPSFLYVVYLLLLMAIPMGILAAFDPPLAERIAQGTRLWLAAIPGDIVDLFEMVMLGYIGGRSLEKIKGAAK